MTYIEKMYLDYANNFLSVSAFAQHHLISESLAHEIIKEGRNLNNNIQNED